MKVAVGSLSQNYEHLTFANLGIITTKRSNPHASDSKLVAVTDGHNS